MRWIIRLLTRAPPEAYEQCHENQNKSERYYHDHYKPSIHQAIVAGSRCSGPTVGSAGGSGLVIEITRTIGTGAISLGKVGSILHFHKIWFKLLSSL